MQGSNDTAVANAYDRSGNQNYNTLKFGGQA